MKPWMSAAVVACELIACSGASPRDARTDPTPDGNAGTFDASHVAFVQLFEWPWPDIAQECENFLGPKGFTAVQISPPNEHAWIATGDGAPFPWWMRYQPVSYRLESRSGTRAQFVDMVARCKAAGVAIYADAVINHMAAGDGAQSSAGKSPWGNKRYAEVPYNPADFHPTCAINNYNDANNVQGCELSGLPDLDTRSTYVRGKLADYLVDLASVGRLDDESGPRPQALADHVVMEPGGRQQRGDRRPLRIEPIVESVVPGERPERRSRALA